MSLKLPSWRRVLALVLYGVVGGLGLTNLAFLHVDTSDALEPRPYEVCCQTPEDWGFEYESVDLDAGEVRLSGWYIPSRNRAAVLLIHPGGSSRLGVVGFAHFLAGAGYGVLLYDRRANAESTGEQRSMGWLDTRDVPALLHYLQQREDVDADRIGVLGASIGGQVALRAAAEHPEIRAVVADGPSLCGFADRLPIGLSPARFIMRGEFWLWLKLFAWRLGVDAPPAVVDIIADIAPRPVFLIAAGGIEAEYVGRYHDFAAEPKELWVIPEAEHGETLKLRPEEYSHRVVEFFDRALIGAGPRLTPQSNGEL